VPRVDAAAAEPRAVATTPRRSRLTGRAAVLVLVVAVLMVSYASSMKAYLQQRSHVEELRSQIAERESRIAKLEREKERWEDPAYVRQQARERFGYVLPGETSFVVVDGNGDPVDDASSLHDPADVVKVEPTAWWTSAWASMELAGRPPRMEPPPVERIGAPATKIRAGSE